MIAVTSSNTERRGSAMTEKGDCGMRRNDESDERPTLVAGEAGAQTNDGELDYGLRPMTAEP